MRASTTRSPSLEEVLRAAIDYRLLGVHTALPARVESYDATSQKINAKPLVRALTPTADGGELNESVPIITDVPVIFPRAGGFFISLPVQQGDHVLLIFNERSVDKFIAGDGSEVDPIDPRDHDLSDAVALVGFYPFSKSLADADPTDAIFGKDGGAQIRLKPDGISLGKDAASAAGAAEAMCLATTLKTFLDTLETFMGLFFPANWTPVGGDGGAALQLAITTAFPTAPTVPVVESAHHKLDE